MILSFLLPLLLFVVTPIYCREILTIDATTLPEITTGLIVFAAPWCPHCQRLEVELASLVDRIDVDVGIVDCDANKPLCESNKAFGYPTIYFKK
jgi:thiol-disulfide isomerase/thioredoxin